MGQLGKKSILKRIKLHRTLMAICPFDRPVGHGRDHGLDLGKGL